MKSARAQLRGVVRDAPGTASLEIEELFRRWHTRQDRRARDEIVHRFLPLAHSLAQRYHGTYMPLEDLQQVAAVGLLNAIKRFDPERGTDFRAFAVPTILGELKRYIRDTGWATHVPRPVQELSLDVNRAIGHLTAAKRRSPRIDEIAQYLRITTEETLTGLDAIRVRHPQSLEQPVHEGEDGVEMTVGDTLGEDDDHYALVDTVLSFAATISTLPSGQRQALTLRLHENLVQSEIAHRMGCSQMHVSRLLRRAAAHLRTMAIPSG